MTPASRLLFVRVLFAGLLLAALGLDAKRPGAGGGAGTDAGTPLHFEEVSREVGISFRHEPARLDPKLANVEPHVAALGAAVAVVDADGDGRRDLFVTTSAAGRPAALYRNQGERGFRDVAAEAGLADLNTEGSGACMGSVWADADNDGDADVYVYKWGRAQLFRNDGELRFTDISAGSGLERWMNCNGAVWFDYDRDGLLDLFAGGYFHEQFDLQNLSTTRIMQESFEFANNGGMNYLFRNLGGLRFQDVTERTGVGSRRWTMAAAAADFDGDGWVDLYTANDYGPEELWRNVRGEHFELVASVGLGDDSKSGMCVTLGDVTNEGRLAVYVTNISKEGYLFQGNNLRLNYLEDEGPFLNVARGVVADCGWAWGAQFGDLDNDGWQDLFVVNGFVSASRERDYWYGMSSVAGGAGLLFQDARNWPPMEDRSLSGFERSRVLLNLGRGQGSFRDVASLVGVDDLDDGRAVAFVDLFDRGLLDVVVANQRGPLLVYENRLREPRHWIGLELIGTASNRDAIGAHVTVKSGDWTQVRVVCGGLGFASQNDRRLHFGLGEREHVDEVAIRWPSGGEQRLAAPAVDRYTRVTEETP